MILRDYYCVVCGNTIEGYVESNITAMQNYCEPCGKIRNHYGKCNGGKHFRYRCNDMLSDPTGYIECMGVRAGYPENPTEMLGTQKYEPKHDLEDGTIYHDMPKFSKDARDEKLNKKRFEKKRREGRQKIFIDRSKND